MAASFLAATNGNPAFEDLSMGNSNTSSDVQALIDWCGPNADFCEMKKQLKALGCKHIWDRNLPSWVRP